MAASIKLLLKHSVMSNLEFRCICAFVNPHSFSATCSLTGKNKYIPFFQLPDMLLSWNLLKKLIDDVLTCLREITSHIVFFHQGLLLSQVSSSCRNENRDISEEDCAPLHFQPCIGKELYLRKLQPVKIKFAYNYYV